MNRATPQMRHFARRLIEYETKGNKFPGLKPAPTFSEYERLRPHLVVLMGTGGFQMLLLRARVQASAEVPGLRAVQVNEDGTLGGLDELHQQLNANELSEGRLVLLARLLGLLVTFVGENLTLRLVTEVWPKVPPDDLGIMDAIKDGKTGGKNEKAK